MKKVIFMGVLGLFLLGSCNSKSGDSHEGHNHETEEHNHDGHDHEGHDHEHEEHNHEHEEQENHAGGSDEIILPPAKAQAAGVAVSTVEPGSFHQVIKTSGQVMAAQGDESGSYSSRRGFLQGKSYRRNECQQRYSFGGIVIQKHGRRRPGAESPDSLRGFQKRIRAYESACRQQNRI